MSETSASYRTLFRMRLPFAACWYFAVVASVGSAVEPNPRLSKFLAAHCVECHTGESAEASLDMQALEWSLSNERNFARWTRILERVHDGSMPPADASELDRPTRRRFVSDLAKRLVAHNRRQQALNGRTPIRRLSRDEYERTVQDLLGITKPLASLLPAETPLHGFDTVSNGLRFSPLHIERYLEAADAALQEALRFYVQPQPINKRILIRELKAVREHYDDDKVIFLELDDATVVFDESAHLLTLRGLDIKSPGMYRIRARAWGYQTERPVVLRIHAGNWGTGTTRVLGFFDLQPEEPREVEIVARLEIGEYLFPAPDDLHRADDGFDVWHLGGATYEGSGVAIDWVEVEGPLDDTWPPPSVAKLLLDVPVMPVDKPAWRDGFEIGFEPVPKEPIRDLKRIVRRFVARAFRRVPSTQEVQRFQQAGLDALQDGASFEVAVRLACRTVLTSPQFLILNEQPGELDDFALASRLSYFLWGTMPDTSLLKLASQSKLSDPAELRRQIERMLQDERSQNFVQRFVDQWLDLQRIDATSPDRNLYPEYDELLKLSMLDESRGFFRELLEQDMSVVNFVDADFVMVNRRLAEHYGLEPIVGQQTRRVELPSDSVRGGVLTQAAVLKVTANGTVTSPVTRGTWVLTKLLNQAPQPPPPGIGSIEPDTRGATTVREQLRLHRDDRSCASCHQNIDPPGFALESFDVVGGYRERYRAIEHGDDPQAKWRGRKLWEYKLGPPVDSSGRLPTGESFADVVEFKQHLAQQKERVAKAVTSQLLVYATGHPIELADRPVVSKIVTDTRENDHGLRSLIHAIVQSALFRSK